MNLRRRRRARTLALAAFLVAALVWAFSAIFWTSWASPAHAWNARAIHRYQVELADGSFYATNRGYMNGGWVFYLAAVPHPELVPPSGFYFLELVPNPVGASRTRISVLLPLWIPLALTLPPLLLTHARVRRPLARHRRGLAFAAPATSPQHHRTHPAPSAAPRASRSHPHAPSHRAHSAAHTTRLAPSQLWATVRGQG